jgi:hypothetical protein
MMIAVACNANAGGNPDVRAYIDFGPPSYVHAMSPAPYTLVDMYLCLDELGSGMSVIAFSVTDLVTDFPGVFATQSFMSLLPGDIPVGGWHPWAPQGAVVSSTECCGSDGQPLVVGYISAFYLGGEAWVEILDHPEYPRWVVDCEEPPGEHDEYCVYRNGSIGGAEAPAGDCDGTPIASSSWGALKALCR